MSGLVFAAAGLCGLALAALALSLLALYRLRALLEASVRRARASRRDQDAELEAVRQKMDTLANRVEEIRVVPHTAASPRPGMNLNRRSQALRMHRRGEPVGRIAAELEIPVQEVELLIKVHEIVMSTV